jgi:hypothetical protein
MSCTIRGKFPIYFAHYPLHHWFVFENICSASCFLHLLNEQGVYCECIRLIICGMEVCQGKTLQLVATYFLNLRTKHIAAVILSYVLPPFWNTIHSRPKICSELIYILACNQQHSKRSSPTISIGCHWYWYSLDWFFTCQTSNIKWFTNRS